MSHERSVLVRAELHGLAGSAGRLREVAREHAERLAAVAGCFAASASEPLTGEPGEFRLDVWWRDETALRAHYATAEYARYAQQVGELLARPSDVTVLIVDRSYRAAPDLSADPTRQG